MNQLNSDFLERIADSYGDNAQFSAPPMVEGLLPVVQADLYRSRLIHFFDALSPTGLLTQATIQYPGDERLQTRIYVGEFGTASAFRTSLTMQTTFTVGKSSGFIVVGGAIVPAGGKENVVGPASMLDKNSPMNVFIDRRPFEIVLPPGEKLFLTFKNDEGGNLAASVLSWHFVGRTEAPPAENLRQAPDLSNGF